MLQIHTQHCKFKKKIWLALKGIIKTLFYSTTSLVEDMFILQAKKVKAFYKQFIKESIHCIFSFFKLKIEVIIT